jgi:thiosulfate/3-mercaptopyruvate sulfurtransferase
VSANPKGYDAPDLLVTPEDLAAELLVHETAGTEAPLVLDCRAAHAFAQGHIPGAAHVDLWGVSLIDTDPAPLHAFLWMVHHVLVLRGVHPNRPVVACDQQSGLRAARAFWFLEYFGHPSVRVLDGGMDAWERAGLPLTTDALEPVPSEWEMSGDPARVIAWRDLRDRLGTSGVAVLDTRTGEEHQGTLVRARRGGAIPGAVHIEWVRNLDPLGASLPAHELREMYARAGITREQEVITYCQGAYRAAHSYLALRLLGHSRVRVYLGSWKEWGDRDETPIEIPAS